jgi:hypothetical protein
MKKQSAIRAEGRLLGLMLLAAITPILPLRGMTQEQNTPVSVGGSTRLAACPDRAIVEHSQTVALMSAPHRTARPLARLMAGTQLFVCERQGEWYGVVVATVEPERCGVSVALERREAYRGGCTAGWILRKDVVVKIHAAPR